MLSSLSLAAPDLTWRQADDDLFVATLDGEYAGFVGRTSGGFEAHSGRGGHLGTHRHSAEAAAALNAQILLVA